jgi:hypothetical protein
MLFLQLWLAGSIGFVLGWVVHSALAKRRADYSGGVQTIDLRGRPQGSKPSHGRRVASRSKTMRGAEQAVSWSSSSFPIEDRERRPLRIDLD